MCEIRYFHKHFRIWSWLIPWHLRWKSLFTKKNVPRTATGIQVFCLQKMLKQDTEANTRDTIHYRNKLSFPHLWKMCERVHVAIWLIIILLSMVLFTGKIKWTCYTFILLFISNCMLLLDCSELHQRQNIFLYSENSEGPAIIKWFLICPWSLGLESGEETRRGCQRRGAGHSYSNGDTGWL